MIGFRIDAAGGALLLVGGAERLAVAFGGSIVDRIARVMVDLTPLPLVEETIRLVGTTDKPALRAGLVGGAAFAAGVAAPGRPRAHGALIGAVAGAIGLAGYVSARRRLTALESEQDRGRRRIDAAHPLPEVSDGAEHWPGVEPLYTDVERFYQTDVNLRSPLVDPTTWRLDVVGLDSKQAEISYDRLLELPLGERDALMVCIHNRLGWDRLGHQRWTGVGLPEVFGAAGVQLPDDPTGVDLVMEAVDGYRQVLPLQTALASDSWIVVGMAGRALTAGHGFPARITTPGLAGQYNGVKWLRRLTLAPTGAHVATWVARGWPREEVVPPPMARIDHPGTITMPPRLPQRAVAVQGALTLVGTAWAPAHGGVAAVEVRLDDGPWTSAELASDLGPGSWRRWRADLTAAPGTHAVSARCVTADGTVQEAEVTPPFPDGVTGHHTLQLRVEA